jgi:putative flippase GtrA
MLILSVLLWRFPTNTMQILVVYNSLAYTGGAASSFFLNKYWTFGRGQRPTSKEVGRFVISMFLELLASNGLVWLIGNALHPFIANAMLWGNTTKLLAVAGNAVLSYLIMRFWVFGSETQKRPKQRAPSSTKLNARGWKVLSLTWFSEECLAKLVPLLGTICKDRQPEEDHAIEGEQPQSVDN